MNRIPVFIVCFCLTFPGLASAHSWTSGKPAMPALTAKEAAKIADGKLVLRTERDESRDDVATVTGIIDIEASPEAIWAILLDFESIPETSSAMKDADRYEDREAGTGRIVGMRYMLKVAWVEIVYHVHHDCFEAEKYLVWTLDPSKENGIEATEGSFSLHDGARPGTTRFLYRTMVSTGRSVPKWVEEDLSESSLKSYIKHVKAAAER